jgi:predicted nucleic acid-binding protein
MRRFGGKSSDPLLESWARGIPASQLFISTVTMIEFDSAVNQLKLEALELAQSDPELAQAKSEDAEILRTWILEKLSLSFENRILSIDHQVSHRMAGLKRSVSDKGAYTVIAATAQVHRIPIVTRHPERYAFADVSIVNPWAAVDKAPNADHFEFMQQTSTGIGI